MCSKASLKTRKKAQVHFWGAFIVNLTKNICWGTFVAFGGIWGTFGGLWGTPEGFVVLWGTLEYFVLLWGTFMMPQNH